MIFNLKKTGHNGKDCYMKITTTAAAAQPEAGKTKIATARPKETTRTAAYRTVLHFLWRKFRASSFTVFYFSFRVVGFGAKGGGWGKGDGVEAEDRAVQVSLFVLILDIKITWH